MQYWTWQAADAALGKARLGGITSAATRRIAAGARRNPARRWVVDRTLAWLSKCRALLVRYDKRAANFLGLMQLACALLW